MASSTSLMPPTGDTTVPSVRDAGATRMAVVRDVMALVIAWSAHEPHRVGELALFDGVGPWILGRTADDLDQSVFVRQQPGNAYVTGALTGDSISRRQLRFYQTNDGLWVENIGKGEMLVNGVVTKRAKLVDGDVIERRGRYVFVVVERQLSIAYDGAVHAFGEADAHGIVGESACIWSVRARHALVAQTNQHVLVTGESGTGKELVAKAIHALSNRSKKELVSRSATSLPAGLIDVELFGNPRNFPHAGMPEREGLIGRAHGGTLFLDEIGEIPPELQAHLLRVLDRGEYSRIGEATTRRADLRVVAATNRDPSELKSDLAARFTLEVEMPSLADRREDIPLLVRHMIRMAANESPELAKRFVREVSGREEIDVDPALVVAALRLDIPMNVRDLHKLVWRAIMATPKDEGTLRLAPADAVAPRPQATTPAPPRHIPDADTLRALLVAHEWNVSRVGDALQITRFKVARAMDKYGIERP